MRQIPLRSSSSSTVLNLYNNLFRFMTVAGLTPTATTENNGLMSRTSYNNVGRRLYINKSPNTWVELATSLREEGHMSSGIIEIAGGSNYVYTPCLIYVSFSNQGKDRIVKNEIISGNQENSYAVGYLYDTDNTLHVYLKTSTYSSFIFVRLIQNGSYVQLSKGIETTTEPNGITYL